MAITHSVKFTASAKEAAAEILKYEDQIVATASSVDRHAASLSGEQMFRASHNWVAAVEQIGGVTNLTTREKARLHAQLGEVVEKYEVLGHQAPTQLRQVYEATTPAAQATESWTASVTKNAAAYVAGMATWEGAKQIWRSTFEFVKGSVEAYGAAEAAQIKLTTALQNQHIASTSVREAYRQQASELQRLTKYEDDQIAVVQAMLVQVGNVMPSQMDRATKAVLDLATGLGVSLETATQMVAKSAAGNTDVMGRYGISISKAAVENRGLDAVLEAVNKRFAGQAQAEIEGYAGQLQQLHNLYGDLQESIGEATVKNDTFKLSLIALRALLDDPDVGNRFYASIEGGLAAAIPGLGAVIELWKDFAGGVVAADRAQRGAETAYRSTIEAWVAGIPPLVDTSVAMELFNRQVKEQAEAQKAAARAAEDAAKRQDALFGRDVIARAQQYARDLGGIENITRLTAAKKQELADAVGKALEVYRALGRQAPIELHRIWIAATELSDPALTRGLPDGLLKNLRRVSDEAYWVGQASADNFERGMTYGDPGFFLDWMLHTPGSGMLQYDPKDEMPSFGRRIAGAMGDGMIEVAGRLPETFAEAFTGGGGASGAFKAIGMQMGGVVGEALGAEIGDKVGTSLKGSLGDKLGSALGGAIGSAVGFAIQGVVSLIGQIGPKAADEQILARVGSRYGATITQALAEGIEANAKTLFRGDWLAAEIFNLGAIIDAAGGVTDASFTKWAQATRDIFVMVETGKFTTDQAATALDQTFVKLTGHLRESGALASAEFLELIALQERFHIESAAVESYVASQAESAIGHLTRVVETSAIQSQAAATALADTGVRALQTLIEQGVPLGTALQQYDAYTTALTKRLSEAGFQGTEAFAQLQAQSALAKDAVAGPLLTAIVETGLAIRDLHNGNLLTQESFGGLVSQVAGLSEQWIAQGHSAQELFPFIGGQLQTIWELQQKFGYSVDEATQKLLDEAEASGVIGAAHQSTQDRMIDGIDRIAAATERLAELFGETMPDAMARGSKAIASDAQRLSEHLDWVFRRRDWTPPDLEGLTPPAPVPTSAARVSYAEGYSGAFAASRLLPASTGRSAASLVPAQPATLPPIQLTVISKLNNRAIAREQILVQPEMLELMGGRG